MKATININQKIGQPNFGSFGASCSFEIDIDQAALEKSPDTILAHCRLLADLARVAVERELDLQRRKSAVPAREPGEDDDQDLRPGDPAYERSRQPAPAPQQRQQPSRQPYNQQDWERDQPDQRPYGGGPPPWQQQGAPAQQPQNNGGRTQSGPPQNGRQFLGWLGKQDQSVKHRASKIAKSWNLPSMMKDWPDDAALAIYRELTNQQQPAPAWGGQQNGNGYHSNGAAY